MTPKPTNAADMPELLPCPFCGGKAEYYDPPEDFQAARTRCRKCGISVYGYAGMRDGQAKKWNTRASGNALAGDRREALGFLNDLMAEAVSTSGNLDPEGFKYRARKPMETIRLALSAPELGKGVDVDLEALKRDPRVYKGHGVVDEDEYCHGWNDCIDHLFATGRLAQPAPDQAALLEAVRDMSDTLRYYEIQGGGHEAYITREKHAAVIELAKKQGGE